MAGLTPSGLVLLRDGITTVRESREKRLVLSNNNNTSMLDLILFVKNPVAERATAAMMDQEAFTYESIMDATRLESTSVERVIQWLCRRGFIRLWGKRYNPAAPHTKIWLVDGGDEERAKKLKMRRGA